MGLTPELILSLDAPQFEDAETARRYLQSQAWPEAPVCSRCGKRERTKELGTLPGRFKCYDCHSFFSVTVGTVFQATKLPLHKWLQATAAVAKTPCTTHELGDALGIQQRTAWRIRKLIRPDIRRGKSSAPRQPLCYPFLPVIKVSRPEHEMLRAVSEAVPHNIPHDRRADICQELVLALLIGDIEIADLPVAVWKMFHKVYAFHPTKYGPLSLDAVIPGTDDLRLIDTISTEQALWAA
jgi:transposase-like protein